MQSVTHPVMLGHREVKVGWTWVGKLKLLDRKLANRLSAFTKGVHT